MKKKTFKKVIRNIFVFIIALILILGIAWMIFYFHRSDPKDYIKYDTSNPHTYNDAQVCAHRSGAGIMPEETLMAFKYTIENKGFEIDYFEFDLHLTKDEQIVLLHDDTLGRTSDCLEVFGVEDDEVKNRTLSELKKLNMGAKFVTVNGNTPYADLKGENVSDDLRIATLDEVLDYITAQGDFNYIIEIKDEGDRGKRVADMLYVNLKERGILDNTLVCSFKDEILQYVEAQYPDATRGAGVGETTDFIFAALLDKKDYVPTFDAVQLPFADIKESYGINTGLVKIINYGHSKNISMAYWTINDAEDMKYLRSIGADIIISDYPDVLSDVLKEAK